MNVRLPEPPLSPAIASQIGYPADHLDESLIATPTPKPCRPAPFLWLGPISNLVSGREAEKKI